MDHREHELIGAVQPVGRRCSRHNNSHSSECLNNKKNLGGLLLRPFISLREQELRLPVVAPENTCPVGSTNRIHSPGVSRRTARTRIRAPALGIILCKFDDGARGHFATSGLCAVHKSDLTFEVCGSRATCHWEQELPAELWIGHRE